MLLVELNQYIAWDWDTPFAFTKSSFIRRWEYTYCICKSENWLQQWKENRDMKSSKDFTLLTCLISICCRARGLGVANTRHNYKGSLLFLFPFPLHFVISPHTFLGATCQQILCMSFSQSLL